MRISKSSMSVLIMVIGLTAGNAISTIINPEVYSLEAFMLGGVAAFLAGIWHELREMNKQRRESDNRLSETDRKLTSE